MKKLAIISAIAISSLFYNAANAQVRLRVGINFSPRPVYVPERVVVSDPEPVVYNEPVNYDGDEDYYYLPDVDAYYSMNDRCYYYNNGGSWVTATYLPGAYRNYDWRSARRYEIRASRPYMHHDYYRNRYNGVAFNGRWNERVYGGYGNVYRGNHERYDNRYNDRNRFDNHGRFGRNDDRFTRNNNGHDRFDRDNHRPGRF